MAFDDAIRKSFPNIGKLLEVVDEPRIDRFFRNLNGQCDPMKFWWMNVDGGNNCPAEIGRLSGRRWLLSGYYEVVIEKLIVHFDPIAPYDNFFILLLDQDEPFPIVDELGNQKVRANKGGAKRDWAVLYGDVYIAVERVQNGYFEVDDEVVAVSDSEFQERVRHIERFAYIVVPEGTATARMKGPYPAVRLLQAACTNSQVSSGDLDLYLAATAGEHHPEIIMYR